MKHAVFVLAMLLLLPFQVKAETNIGAPVTGLQAIVTKYLTGPTIVAGPNQQTYRNPRSCYCGFKSGFRSAVDSAMRDSSLFALVVTFQRGGESKRFVVVVPDSKPLLDPTFMTYSKFKGAITTLCNGPYINSYSLQKYLYKK